MRAAKPRTIRDIRVVPVSAADEFPWYEQFLVVANRITDKLRKAKFAISNFDHVYLYISFSGTSIEMSPHETDLEPWFKVVEVSLPSSMQKEAPSSENIALLIRDALLSLSKFSPIDGDTLVKSLDVVFDVSENSEFSFLEKNTREYKVSLFYKYNLPEAHLVSVYLRVIDKASGAKKEVSLGKMLREFMKARLGSVEVVDHRLVIHPGTSEEDSIFLKMGLSEDQSVPMEFDLSKITDISSVEPGEK